MRFLENNIGFFQAYDSGSDLLNDSAQIILDPVNALMSFYSHLRDFLVFSYPLTIALVFINSPLLLLISLPIAAQLLTLNIPIIIGAAIFAAPALISFGLAVYDVLDFIISPVINCLKILSNVSANLAEDISNIDFDCFSDSSCFDY